jgi:hypothetical protein
MLGAMTLRAVVDYVRTFARAFSVGQPPMYGHLVTARSALESSVVSARLNEPDVAYLERVKRGMCELLYSASEIERLKLPPSPSDRGTATIKGDATGFGWEVRFDRDKPEVDGTKRPSVPDGIRQLLVDDEQARLGRLLMEQTLSSHARHMVGASLGCRVPADHRGERVTTVSVGTDSSQVALQALWVLRALRVAATQRFALMGWNDAQRQDACQHAEEHERVLLSARSH